MKHLKIICAICIAAQLGTISITSQASEILSESTEDTRINALLEQYFSERENDFVNPKLSTIQIIAGQSNDYELSNSEMRSCLISKMEERLDLTIVSSDTTYSISEMTMENNLVHLKVYEWTSVEYSEDSGLIDMLLMSLYYYQQAHNEKHLSIFIDEIKTQNLSTKAPLPRF